MSDAVGLQRFVDAQAGVIDGVLRELRSGRKTGHWMWFVFPQLAGLGMSATSRYYAIQSLQQARDYLAHPVLGERLRACAEAVLASGERSPQRMLGGIDAVKLRSSMTLFGLADPDESRFTAVLDELYGGVADPTTERMLAG